jgi:YfiH family protein
MAGFDSPSWFAPDWPGLPSRVRALTTTRLAGVSPAPYDDGQGGGGFNLGVHVGDDLANVRQNRAALRAVLPAEPLWLSQVHGTVVADANAAVTAPLVGDGLSAAAPEADACIARGPGAVCVIMTADCLPVLFADVSGTVVGAAHAGWRGLAGGVLKRTLEAMRSAGAGEITAWLGPAIGPEKFEVGADVVQAFGPDAPASAFRPIEGSPGKFLADIYALARHVLQRDGVSQISGGEYCTVTQSERFYSYRRDKVTGRQATLIWITPEEESNT